MKLMILTAEPSFAKEAQSAGIDRIFFDLEYINKVERQKGRNTFISSNNIEDIPSIRNVLTSSELLVRTNPIHQYSKQEIDKAIDYGADILMLPMAYDKNDVEAFIQMINGRAKVSIMIETVQALTRIDSILALKGVDELFFGLNDLHIGLGLPFLFEVLSGGLIEYMSEKCSKKNMPFGFGGIARIGDGMLPAEKILGEHIRLGSTSVILSRTFKGEVGENNTKNINLKDEVDKVRSTIKIIENWNNSQFITNQKDIAEIVNKIVYK